MIKIIKDNIVNLKVDAIVNAANTELLAGSGVCGAIFDAAGSELIEECTKLKGCKTGKAKVTKGYNLESKYIIHTPAPVYDANKEDAPKLLRSCYKECLKLAKKLSLKSIAFPCLGTGVYNNPPLGSAKIALDVATKWIKKEESPSTIIFCCFLEEDYKLYKKLAEEYNRNYTEI